MPMDTTQNILKKMIAQGYIIKIVDKSGDEETVEWMVGPRGLAEIGKRGVKRFVEELYGENAPEDLTKRLQRSLGLEPLKTAERETEPQAEAEEEAADGDPGPSTQRRSGRRS